MDLRAERGMVGKMPPVEERQRGRAAGMGIFHVNAIKAQQRKPHRKRARRPAVRPGENLLQPGIHFQRMVCPLSPVVEIASHDNRFTVRQRVGPLGQHFQLRLTMGFAKSQVNAADMDRQIKIGRRNATVKQPAFFTLPDGNVAVFVMFNGVAGQHRVAVMPFRIDRVAAEA